MTIALENLDRFADVRLLVFGDVMLDRYLSGTVDRISPEAPVPVVAVASTSVVAGGAANVAANVIGLGSKCSIVGLIGNDEFSEAVSSACGDLGIDTEGLVRSDNRQTTVKSRLMSDGHQVARFDQETVCGADSFESKKLLTVLEKKFEDCDGIIISDYGKGVVTTDLCEHLIRSANRKGVPVFVDPKGTDYGRYKGADLVTPNQKEAFEAMVSLGHSDASVEAAGRSLIDNYHFSNLLVTRGADGMSLFTSDGSHRRVKSTARTVFDVTGAGDTVIATLAVAKSAGFDLPDAVAIANSAAGIVVEDVGTTAIELVRLKSHLKKEGVLKLEADV